MRKKLKIKSNKIFLKSNVDFVKFAGIWKNREISTKKLRENAWKKSNGATHRSPPTI